MSATIQVTYGANSQEVDVVGKTVGQIREGMAEALNVPKDATALISGEPVVNDYALQQGDRVEFVRASGEKGLS